MKKAKRLVSLLLAFVMLLSLTVVVGAAGSEEPIVEKEVKDKTVTLADNATTSGKDGYRGKINIINANYGEKYDLYQMLYLDNVSEYTDDKGVKQVSYSYVAKEPWYDFVKNAKDANGVNYFKIEEDDATNKVCNVTWGSTGITSNTISARDFAAQALKYAKDNNIAANASANATDFAGVTDENASTYAYKISFTNAGYGYYLLDSSVGALCSLTTAGDGETDITEKNVVPTTDKKVFDVSGYDTDNSANVGDIVYFKSELNVPYMTTDLFYNDKMDEGLTFNNVDRDEIPTASGETTRHKKLTVTYAATGTTTFTELVKDTDYALITEGDELKGYTFRVKFLDAFYNKMKATGTGGAANLSWTVIVYYSATVNSKAVDDTDGLTNEAKLSYGDNGSFSPSSTTKTYTFDMSIFKYTGNTQTPTALSGAEFIIYIEESEGVYKYLKLDSSSTDENAEAEYVLNSYVDSESDATKIITNKSGKFVIKGINHGTYRIKEVNPPAGYNPLKESLSVYINENGEVRFGGKDNVDYVMIKNNSGAELPETGGIGTTIFYVAGSILLIGAAVLLIVKKRMSDEK